MAMARVSSYQTSFGFDLFFFFLLGGDAKRKHEHDDEPSRSPPKRVFGYGESQRKSGSSAGDASATTSQ